MIHRFKTWKRNRRGQYSHDIVDPEERRKSEHYSRWMDHEILRHWWRNFAEVAPGVYRSNHPTLARFERYAAMGIRTVLNLRGAKPYAPYHFEVEACARLGLTLIDLPLGARSAPSRDRLMAVLDALATLETPALMHCKSGADRTGLVAAIYLMEHQGVPVQQARRQLSLRFIHLAFTRTGIQDYLLWSYEERLKIGPIAFRTWVETEYDPAVITAGFNDLSFLQKLRLQRLY